MNSIEQRQIIMFCSIFVLMLVMVVLLVAMATLA
jgi:predicted nucleic acid-binding Zn ribbon protein